MKKIDKIDGCHHCPLKLKTWLYYRIKKHQCTHIETEGLDITEYVLNEAIHPECRLPEDT